MHLTNEDLTEFQAIWKREFGEDLPLNEARQRAFELLELYAVLARPLPPTTERESSTDS